MDFFSPTGVKNVFKKYISQGIFDYLIISEKLYQTIIH
ncbi:hypothetical protein RV14_GL000669 [Enterococcus ratti]|uniref:Uncharacterized protein n=1 Tax=Enterococcus ratti TaxID=150033 RepID=A0A1L8WGY1_9ENTE|nr:hypothetical protein RV14_GL000669 [Enterococcus ratti]